MERLQESLTSNPYKAAVAISIVVFLSAIVFIARRIRRRKRPAMNMKHTLRDCTSAEDLEFEAEHYQDSLDKQLHDCKAAIRRAQRTGYIKTNIAWTEHFEEFSKVSHTLYRNLQYENSKRLNSSKFHRYTDLHFRSMILDHLAYEDYISAKGVRNEINELLVAIGKGTVRVPKSEKAELYKIKDVCVSTTKYLYERMIKIQQETKRLKYKIRDECGQKGQDWFDKMEKNKQRKRMYI